MLKRETMKYDWAAIYTFFTIEILTQEKSYKKISMLYAKYNETYLRLIRVILKGFLNCLLLNQICNEHTNGKRWKKAISPLFISV